MIAKDGHIVLTNFSCAKVLSNTGSPIPSTSSDCGTKEHQAPEMILGWKYDYTVDCWGFGVLLCIMHFGQVISPFFPCAIFTNLEYKHPFLEGDELNPLLIMQKRILRGQEPRYPLSSAPLSEWNLIKKVKQSKVVTYVNETLIHYSVSNVTHMFDLIPPKSSRMNISTGCEPRLDILWINANRSTEIGKR